MSRLRTSWLLYAVLHSSCSSNGGSAFVIPPSYKPRLTPGLARGRTSLPMARVQRRSRCSGWGIPGPNCAGRHLTRYRSSGWGTTIKMDLAAGDGDPAREGLAKQEFKTLLAEGNTKACAQLLRRWGEKLDLKMADAQELLTAASKEPLLLENVEEENIILVYGVLKDAGFLPAFGSIDLDVIPTNSPGVMPETRLTELTGLDLKSLSPARQTGSWLLAGTALFGLQFLIGRALGVDPLQTVVPTTLGLFLVDRIFIRGAVVGTIARAVVPGFKERIVKHEAGHFLLAYLLGCPVQGCILDPFEIGKYGGGSAQGGTMFADPAFATAVSRGKLTNSIINRFSIVLMGGIAAEAIHFGSSEGGSSDEGVLIQILSTINPPFSIQQIKNLALWAAVQAVLLIREHKDAYDELVAALDRGANLGECVILLEKELAKKPLPGELRRASMKPASPADDMRRMMVRRMSQQYAKSEGSIESVSRTQADVDRRMLELQRKVEELERGKADGIAVEDMGFKGGSGGVWLNDLAALRDPTRDPVSTSSTDPAGVSSTSSPPPSSSSTTTTTASQSPSPSSLSSSSSSSPISSPVASDFTLSSADERDNDSVSASDNAVAAQQVETETETETETDRRLREIEMEAVENSRRMAELEERIRRFQEKG